MESNSSRLQEILRDATRPKLKVFLSADIVGSTAYKQRMPSFDGERAAVNWAGEIQAFYQQITEHFLQDWKKWENLTEEILSTKKKKSDSAKPQLFGAEPVFWKTVGDEIIFWKEIGTEDQIWHLLTAWLSAIAVVRRRLKASGLDVKSTAWIAGFPIRNKIIANVASSPIKLTEYEALYGEESSKIVLQAITDGNLLLEKTVLIDQYYRSSGKQYSQFVDFIGSGIDTGFRIAQLASTRRMVLSAELVYLMALSCVSERLLAYNSIIYKENSPTSSLNGIGRMSSAVAESKFTDHFGKLSVHYSGMTQLKGILGGVDYPIFWINTEEEDSLDSCKTEMSSEFSSAQNWQMLKRFCEKYFDDRKAYMLPPFIHPDSCTADTDLTFDEGRWAPMLNLAAHEFGHSGR